MILLCKKPFMAGAISFGCGQCLHCRISRARQWQYRQILESLTHDFNCFITLTYDNRHVRGDWALDPSHVQLFFKRLRKAIAPIKLRYYCVGEYGEDRSRPHYHVNLFGLSEAVSIHGKPFAVLDPVSTGQSRPNVIGGHLFDTWKLGRIHLGEFNWKTAGYCCGYITKHLQDRANQKEWNYPEFARMSNRPGLGFPAVRIIGASLNAKRDHTVRERDVPNELRFGGRKFSLGRYLLAKLRDEVGFASDYSKKFRDAKSYEQSLEMSSLLVPDEGIQTFRQAYLKASTQARLSQEARYNIYRKSGTL